MGKEDDVIGLLNPKREILMKINKEFSCLKKNYSVLLMLKKEKYEEAYLELTKKLLKDFKKGIYITVNKESSELIDEMKEEEIDTSKIKFIDAVSEMVDDEAEEPENISFVSSPNELVELEIAISDAIEEIECGFLIFDSLTTLGVYNDEKRVEKFVHSLSQKTKSSTINDVFLIMKHSKEEFVETVAQFFDKIIEL